MAASLRMVMVLGLFAMAGCAATSASTQRSRTNTASGSVAGTVGSSDGSTLGGHTSGGGSGPGTGGSGVVLGSLDDVLVTELQTFRTTQGLGTLRRDPKLDQAAQTLADVMARKNNLSHRADGQRAGDRIKAAGYTICTYGSPWAENIARSSNFGTAADVAEIMMTGWINSPSHRRNLVGAFAEVGLAVAQSSDGGRIYAAQVFATPGPGPCL